MIGLILTLVFYILPFYRCYTWFHKAYSKGGKWENAEPDPGAVMFTIFPIFNIIAAFNLPGSPLKVQKKKDKAWIVKFFGVKK